MANKRCFDLTPDEPRILPLAILALDDPRALPVLGDAILEAGWFDKRVMQLMLPLKPVGRTASPAQRERARRLRAEFRAGYPEAFLAFASQETTGLTRQRWARAVAAVLLFGGWSKKRWSGVPRFGASSATRRSPSTA